VVAEEENSFCSKNGGKSVPDGQPERFWMCHNWRKSKIWKLYPHPMYVLARHEGESIIVADIIEIKVLSVTGKIVRLGVIAPREVDVHRKEISDRLNSKDQEVPL
jgi:carbon storage regulator